MDAARLHHMVCAESNADSDSPEIAENALTSSSSNAGSSAYLINGDFEDGVETCVNREDIKGSFSAASSTAEIKKMSISDEEELRLRLKFFFMNPVEKYFVRRRVPWKLLLQVLKIVFVTIQLIVFGRMRMGHVIFMDEADTTLRHIFFSEWSSDRDIRSYPPGSGPYSVYTVDQLYEQLSYAIQKYYVINSTSFGNYEYDYNDENDNNEFPAQKLCIVQYSHGERFLPNNSYFFDTRLTKNCTPIKLDKKDRESKTFSIVPFLEKINMTLDLSRFMKAILSFNLKTINLNKVMSSDLPDCFLITVQIVFDNSMHSGQVTVNLFTEAQYIDCNGIILYARKLRSEYNLNFN
ncbi:unnamed protein product [Soboliphyme baturini]|uniref:Mucolipin-3 n=1 Tax=Soboliphyme baturini TaxID=241478 RepID=A0A183J320_9BILA|nr:unnamed protein product [Soboliphyme baturini]